MQMSVDPLTRLMHIYPSVSPLFALVPADSLPLLSGQAATYTYTYMHTYIYTYMHTYTYTCTYVYTYTYTYAYLSIQAQLGRYLSSLGKPLHIYTHTHTYIHTYKHMHKDTYPSVQVNPNLTLTLPSVRQAQLGRYLNSLGKPPL